MNSSSDMNIGLIVICAFDEHCLMINDIRRKQCEKYGIPVIFTYNGGRPENYTLKSDEIDYEVEGLPGPNPSMLVKFMIAVKLFEKKYIEPPKFYVRCNATCFIDFKKLPIVLRNLSFTHCIAGRFDSKYDDRLFCNGTCMILSNDVAKKISDEDINNNIMTVIENDDVSISWIGRKYGVLFDLSYWFSIFEGLEELPEKLPDAPRHIVFYRIKNPPNRVKIDVGLWKMLYERSLI